MPSAMVKGMSMKFERNQENKEDVATKKLETQVNLNDSDKKKFVIESKDQQQDITFRQSVGNDNENKPIEKAKTDESGLYQLLPIRSETYIGGSTSVEK